jgi:hypothetical protein
VSGSTTVSPTSTSATLNFTVTIDCCPVYLEIEWLCSSPSAVGTFAYSSDQLAF